MTIYPKGRSQSEVVFVSCFLPVAVWPVGTRRSEPISRYTPTPGKQCLSVSPPALSYVICAFEFADKCTRICRLDVQLLAQHRA